MADKKLNEVTKVTDMAYVPVIMSDGSIGQIAKADLASVVAGILAPFKMGGRLQSGFDLNTLLDFGIYSFTTGDVINSGSDGASVLIIYGYAPNRVLQVQITSSGNIYSRLYTNSWSAWSRMLS